ncbi:MAG TPA: hypothetical protein VHX11_09675 [Acidobacteriaceae bacterium]|jgi:hypothetical protein|nr:hypothetical protein [Acidobacteriaceae bacterium]
MKLKLSAIFLCVLFIAAVEARATILPDSCGDDSVRFNVKTTKNKTPLPSPPDGKAQVVLIENENQMIGPFMYATIRYGMDGAWVGANNNNSYFVVSVDPGVHHLCVAWQSGIGKLKKSIDVAKFTAEAGKVYYFAADVKVIPCGENCANFDFGLSQLDDDEGAYRVKAWKFASATQDK